jgi:hypothetical protein
VVSRRNENERFLCRAPRQTPGHALAHPEARPVEHLFALAG